MEEDLTLDEILKKEIFFMILFYLLTIIKSERTNFGSSHDFCPPILYRSQKAKKTKGLGINSSSRIHAQGTWGKTSSSSGLLQLIRMKNGHMTITSLNKIFI